MAQGFLFAYESNLGIIALAHLKGWKKASSTEELQQEVNAGAMGILIHDKDDRLPPKFLHDVSERNCFFLTLTGNTKPERIDPEKFITFEPDTFVSKVKTLSNLQKNN